jgi:hypothetical protein
LASGHRACPAEAPSAKAGHQAIGSSDYRVIGGPWQHAALSLMRTVSLAIVAVAALAQPALAQDASPPLGAEVSVQLLDGTRAKGRLVSLSSSEVVLRRYEQAPEIRHKLTDVRRVETVHHNRRNLALAGLGIGMAVALLGDWCGTGAAYGSGTEPSCFTAMPALVTAGGAATGALIGHAMDTKRRRILFIAPGGQSSRAPAPRGLVVGASIRW